MSWTATLKSIDTLSASWRVTITYSDGDKSFDETQEVTDASDAAIQTIAAAKVTSLGNVVPPETLTAGSSIEVSAGVIAQNDPTLTALQAKVKAEYDPSYAGIL